MFEQSEEALATGRDVGAVLNLVGRPIALSRDVVTLDPDEDGNWGDLIIKRGLKRRARKRVLKINDESKSKA